MTMSGPIVIATASLAGVVVLATVGLATLIIAMLRGVRRDLGERIDKLGQRQIDQGERLARVEGILGAGRLPDSEPSAGD